ncbi:hypothetical protein JCM8097_001497 [Rhodosporidiobolus ruineniae]
MGNPEVAELAVDLGPSFEVLPPRRPDEMTRDADEAWVRRGFDFGCSPSPRKGPFSPGQVFECKCWVLHKLEGHLTVSLTGRSEIKETSEATADSVTVSPVESHVFAQTSMAIPGTAQGSYLPYVFSLTLPSAPNAGCFAGFQRPPPLPSSFEGSNAAVRFALEVTLTKEDQRWKKGKSKAEEPEVVLSVPFKVRNTASSAAWSALSHLDPLPHPSMATSLYLAHTVEGSQRIARVYLGMEKPGYALEEVELRFSPVVGHPTASSLLPCATNIFHYRLRALLRPYARDTPNYLLPYLRTRGTFGAEIWVEKTVAYRPCGTVGAAGPHQAGKGKGKGKSTERSVAGAREVRYEMPERMDLEALDGSPDTEVKRVASEIKHDRVRAEVEFIKPVKEGQRTEERVWVEVEGEAKLCGRRWNGLDVEQEVWLPRARTCNLEQRFDLCAVLTEFGKPLHDPVRFRDFQLDLPSASPPHPTSASSSSAPPANVGGSASTSAPAPAHEAAPAYDATFPGEPDAQSLAGGGGAEGEAPPAYESREAIDARLKGLFRKGREKN